MPSPVNLAPWSRELHAFVNARCDPLEPPTINKIPIYVAERIERLSRFEWVVSESLAVPLFVMDARSSLWIPSCF